MIFIPSLRDPFVADLDEARTLGPSLVWRLARAATESRQRRAERHVGELIERRGGRVTDQIERLICDRAAGLGPETPYGVAHR